MRTTRTISGSSEATISRLAAKLMLAALIMHPLAACKHDENRGQVAGWALVDPSERHPIIVSQEPQTVSFNVSRGAQGLTPQQRAHLLAFAQKSRASDAGNSRLIISAPSGTSNEIAAMSAVGEIRRILSDRGFSESAIQVEAYSDAGSHEPPVRISYLRYVAEAPQCGNWSTNLAEDMQNLPYPNLGCANQKNLAAMVANPADLLGPNTESPRPSERRDATWQKYVKGESTVADKGEDEKVQVQGAN